MSFQSYVPSKKSILLVPDYRTRAWITLSGHISHTCNQLLIIIPNYNVVKEHWSTRYGKRKDVLATMKTVVDYSYIVGKYL